MKFHKSFYFWALIVLLVLGSLVRFYNLGNIVLNRDEPLHTIRVCYQSFSFVRAFNQSSAFFSLLVHFLLPLGKVEFVARFPSAVFGILCILMTYFLGKLLFSKREGLLAAVFVSVSPFFINYSQYSRAYTAYAFFTMLSMYFFMKALKEHNWYLWLLFIISTFLLFYTHLFSLIILPVYTIFVLLMLWFEWKEKKKSFLGQRLYRIYLPFILSIFVISMILVFLYYPDQGARNLFQSYFLTTGSASSTASLNPWSLFKNIFYDMSYFTNYSFFWIMSGLASLGLIFGFMDKRKSSFFIILSIFIPYLFFIFSGPRERDIASVTRYFIFFLPMFFICLANGINKVSNLISEYLLSKKLIPSRKNLLRILLVSGISLLVVSTFNFKKYYLNIVRSQSFYVDKKVHDFFKKELRHDAYVFFNTFPAQYLNLIASPLTKGISPQEIPLIFRPNLEVLKDSNDFMIYGIRDGLMDRISFFDMETWVVIKVKPERIEPLIRSSQKVPEADLSVIDDHVIIRLKEGFGSISKKMHSLLSVLLSSKPIASEKNFLHLASARFWILEGKVFNAEKELIKTKEDRDWNKKQDISYSPFIFRTLDKFFFKSQYFPEVNFRDLYKHHIASLCFQTGNDLYRKRKLREAQRAYNLAAGLDEDLSIQIASKYEGIGNFLLFQGKGNLASEVFAEAIRLNPSSSFLHFFLAESYYETGWIIEAKKALCQGLGIDKLPEDVSRRIETEKPFILVWKKKSKWNLLIHSIKKRSYSGRIFEIKDLGEVESFQLMKKDNLSYEKGEIEFSLTRSKRRFRGFQFKSKDKAINLEFYINEEPAQDKIIFLNFEESNLQVINQVK